jgi:hypothetical protein
MSECPDGKIYVDCWQCGGEGVIEGECTCGEDCCCCLEPEPPVCDICRGKGGYYVPIDSEAARDALGLPPEAA